MEGLLDGREDLRADGRAGLSERRSEAHVVASERGGEGFRGGEEGGHAGTHLTEGEEDTVHDDEEWEDRLDGAESTAEDETPDTPQGEAKGHGLLAADLVHEVTADDASGQVEAVDDCTEADVLNQSVLGAQLTDDGG